MTRPTAVITGASDGIGRETAMALAGRGFDLILVGRNPDKTAAVAAAIGRDSGHQPAVEIADLSSQSSIQDLAGRLNRRPEPITVLINNAGGYFAERRESADGIELTFALNHLAYFTLTGLLLDRLRAAGPARVINVASAAHRGRPIDFDDPQGRRRYRGWRAYQQSKLANILFTYHLAGRLAGSNVTVNCLHPGFVASRFGHNNAGWRAQALRLLQRLVAISPQAGAQTSVHLASAAELAGITGGYFVRCRPAVSSAASRDPAAQARLWQVSEALTGVRYPLP